MKTTLPIFWRFIRTPPPNFIQTLLLMDGWMDRKVDIRIAFLNNGTDIQKSLKNGTDKQKSGNKEESDMTDRQEETKSLDIETKTKLDLNICQEHGCVVFITKY